MGRDFVDLKDGDVLEPYHINQIYKELRRLRKLKGSARVIVRGMQDGESVPEIDIALPPSGFIGVANGAIAPRVNSTVGSGSVIIKQISGNSLTNAQVSEVTAYNVSANTMTSGNGITNGAYVWVQRDAFGAMVVSPFECD